MNLLQATNRATKPLRALKPPKECNAFGGFSFAQGEGPLRTLMRDAQWPQGISVLKCSQPIATSVGGTLYYVHSAHPSASLRAGLGSTVAISDVAGQAVDRVQYAPNGEVITTPAFTSLPIYATISGSKRTTSQVMGRESAPTPNKEGGNCV